MFGAGEGLEAFDGAGEPQFVSSAVVDPGCDTADPEGEFDDPPLLWIG